MWGVKLCILPLPVGAPTWERISLSPFELLIHIRQSTWHETTPTPHSFCTRLIFSPPIGRFVKHTHPLLGAFLWKFFMLQYHIWVSFQISQSQSQSHTTTDGRSVSQSVSQSVCLGVETKSGNFDERLFFFQNYCLVFFFGLPLWREVESVMCQSLSLKSTIVWSIYNNIYIQLKIYTCYTHWK
jgi:hypothetical protein